MPLFLQKRAPKIAIGAFAYGTCKHLGLPTDASKVCAMAIFSYMADNDDLEFVTPMLLTPVVQSRIRSSIVSNGIYSISMGYITWIWCFDRRYLSIPKHLRRFLDRNCGLDNATLSRFRSQCSEKGWPENRLTENQDQRAIMIRCIKSLVMSLGKLEALSLILKMILSRKFKVNMGHHALAWLRMVVFCFVIMQISVL